MWRRIVLSAELQGGHHGLYLFDWRTDADRRRPPASRDQRYRDKHVCNSAANCAEPLPREIWVSANPRTLRTTLQDRPNVANRPALSHGVNSLEACGPT